MTLRTSQHSRLTGPSRNLLMPDGQRGNRRAMPVRCTGEGRLARVKDRCTLRSDAPMHRLVKPDAEKNDDESPSIPVESDFSASATGKDTAGKNLSDKKSCQLWEVVATVGVAFIRCAPQADIHLSGSPVLI